MDDQLAERIRLFRESGRVRPGTADFVTAELHALAREGWTVTEASAGLLTSHLLMALTRLLDGEPVGASPTDARVAAELTDHPQAVARARAVSARAERELGSALPESEIGFLGLHLAVLPRRAAPEASRAGP